MNCNFWVCLTSVDSCSEHGSAMMLREDSDVEILVAHSVTQPQMADVTAAAIAEGGAQQLHVQPTAAVRPATTADHKAPLDEQTLSAIKNSAHYLTCGIRYIPVRRRSSAGNLSVSATAIRAATILSQSQYVLWAVLALYAIMPIFERPYYCYRTTCGPADLPLASVPYLSADAYLGIELACVLVIGAATILQSIARSPVHRALLQATGHACMTRLSARRLRAGRSTRSWWCRVWRC